MPEIGPVMRALELQRLLEDKVTEWRERSTRVAGASVADSYQQPLHFKRHTNRRKNSAEINRIIAKYSKPNRRTVETIVAPINNVKPPERPARQKKSNLKLSRSEDNLVQATIMDHPDPAAEVKTRFNFSKYNARSCEDITAFVDIDRNKKSRHFEENSILNAKVVTPVPPIRPKRLHSISNERLDSSDLKDSGIEVRTPNFATSTPVSRRRAVSENVPGFEKCANRSSIPSGNSVLGKGSSEPDILSVSPSAESVGTLGSKKTLKERWKQLKPRKGALDCLIVWRGKKQRAPETRPGWSQNPFWEDEVVDDLSSKPEEFVVPPTPSTSKKTAEKPPSKKRAPKKPKASSSASQVQEPSIFASCSESEDDSAPPTQPPPVKRKRPAQLLEIEEELQLDKAPKPVRAATLRSFLTQRGASGFTTQRNPTKTGEYFIELRVYNSREAERLPSEERWKIALTTLKVAADVNTPLWKAVSKLVQVGKEDFVKIQPIMYPSSQ